MPAAPLLPVPHLSAFLCRVVLRQALLARWSRDRRTLTTAYRHRVSPTLEFCRPACLLPRRVRILFSRPWITLLVSASDIRV